MSTQLSVIVRFRIGMTAVHQEQTCMYNLSAFMAIAAMANNTPGNDSVIGELTTTSSTFSREVGRYSNTNYPDVRLLSFSSKDVDTGTKIEVPGLYANKLLELGQWMFSKAIDGSLSDNKETSRQLIAQEFAGSLEILAIGSMVTNGNYYLPEYIFVKELSSSDDNVLRVWFSDPAFRAQFDQYELVPVPPIDNLDDFHKDRITVQNLIKGITVVKNISKAQELTASSPETILVSREYNWVDKIDPTITYPVPWTVAIYGLAGNNEDVIRQTLVDYILANSAYERSEWELIFPDLFRPTEFYITPLWDRYSLPNQQTYAGMYSPTIPLKDMLGYARQTVQDATDEYLQENLIGSTTVYRGLAFLAVGNPRNRNDLFRFDALWPQYIALSTTNIDFNRIDTDTQQFILKLIEMMKVAETISGYSELPTEMTRIERGDKTYLASSLNNVLYLVSIKSNVIAL